MYQSKTLHGEVNLNFATKTEGVQKEKVKSFWEYYWSLAVKITFVYPTQTTCSLTGRRHRMLRSKVFIISKMISGECRLTSLLSPHIVYMETSKVHTVITPENCRPHIVYTHRVPFMMI